MRTAMPPRIGGAGLLSHTWIDNERDFLALAADWDRLADATDPGNIFLRHGWFAAAWQWHSATHTLQILCIRRGDLLVAILPMMRGPHDQRMRLVRSALTSLDVPDTQRFSLLCAAPDATEASERIVRELRAPPFAHDLLQLRKLYPTPANDALRGLLRTGLGAREMVVDVCPCVDLTKDWDAYYATRTRRLKKGNNLIANRLRKDFATVELRRETLDDSDAGRARFDEMLQVCSTSWKRELSTSLHRRPALDWITALRARSGPSGELVLWCLRLDGQMVAAELQMEHAGEVAALRSEAREAYAQQGVGTYLNWKILERLLGSGRRLYNMGPGISEYKLRWSDCQVEPVCVSAPGPTWRGRIGWWIARLGEAGRARLGRRADTTPAPPQESAE